MKFFLFLTACALFSLTSLAQPELKGSPNDLRQFLYPSDKVVTINGHAEEKAYSDRAIVSLVITTDNKLLSLSISQNSTLRATLAKILSKAGIPLESIKSSKFSSSPQYGWFGKKPSSYKVVNRMAISIEQEEHLKEIASVADKHQEVELSHTSFEHTEKEQYDKKVRALALEKVIKQKEFYEKSLGVKLTPIGITDQNIDVTATPGAMVLEQEVDQITYKEKKTSSWTSEEVVRSNNNSSFDEVVYQANLVVNFKID